MDSRMNTFRFLNNAGGWVVFLISAAAYIVTV
jgi:hypothetical protein